MGALRAGKRSRRVVRVKRPLEIRVALLGMVGVLVGAIAGAGVAGAYTSSITDKQIMATSSQALTDKRQAAYADFITDVEQLQILEVSYYDQFKTPQGATTIDQFKSRRDPAIVFDGSTGEIGSPVDASMTDVKAAYEAKSKFDEQMSKTLRDAGQVSLVGSGTASQRVKRVLTYLTAAAEQVNKTQYRLANKALYYIPLIYELGLCGDRNFQEEFNTFLEGARSDSGAGSSDVDLPEDASLDGWLKAKRYNVQDTVGVANYTCSGS